MTNISNDEFFKVCEILIMHITIYEPLNCTHPGQPWWVGSSLKQFIEAILQVRPLSALSALVRFVPKRTEAKTITASGI